MSDTSQGEGWWQASDGKWYAPELHPDFGKSTGGAADTAGSAWSSMADAASAASSAPTADPTTAIPSVDATAVQPTYNPPEAPSYTPPAYTPPAAPSYNPPQAAPSGWDTAPPAAAPAPAYGEYSYAQQPAPGYPVGAPVGAAASTGIGSLMPVAVIGLIGAALCIIGALLPWAKGAGAVSGDVSGFDSNGGFLLAFGLVIAAGVALLFTGQRNVAIPAAIAVAGVAGIGLFIYSFLDLSSLSDDVAEQISGASLDKGIGLWLAGAGSVLGLIAGIIGVVSLNKKS